MFSESCKRALLPVVALLLPAASLPTAAGSGRSEPLPVRILRADSGRCVGLDRHAVCREAEQRARQQLLVELRQLAHELSGRRLSRQQLAREKAWLASQPGVERESELTVDDKPYGPVAEQTTRLVLPQSALVEWVARLAAQRRRQTVRVLWAAAGTLASLLGGLIAMAKLDRCTGSYYRRALVPAVLMVFLAATMLWWAWLLVPA